MTPSDFARTREPESPSLPGGVSAGESTQSPAIRSSLVSASTVAKKSTATTYDEPADDVRNGCAGNAPEPPSATSRQKRDGKSVAVARERDRQAEQEAKRIRYSLSLPVCGKSAEAIRKRVAAFRRALEAAVIDARGGISLADACAINTACAGERHSSLCASWLRRDADKLTPSERLAHAKGMLEGSERRDKAVTSLRLPGGATEASGGNPSDLYATLQAELAAERTEQAEKTTPTAPTPTEPNGPALVPLSPPATAPVVILHDPDEI